MSLNNDLEWLLVAIYLQEQQIGTEGSFNVGRVCTALEEMEVALGNAVQPFLGMIPGRHRDKRNLTVVLRKRTDLFSERRTSRKVSIFFLTEQGREVGFEQFAYLPSDCARIVGEEFKKLIPGWLLKRIS